MRTCGRSRGLSGASGLERARSPSLAQDSHEAFRCAALIARPVCRVGPLLSCGRRFHVDKLSSAHVYLRMKRCGCETLAMMIGASAKCSHYPIRTTARQPRRVLDSTGVIRLIKYHQIRSKIAARMDDTHTNCTRGIRRHPLTKPSWHYLQNKCGLAFCSIR